MELTEKQESFKGKIYVELERKLSFCTKNERRQNKYAFLITAIRNAIKQTWEKENFSELVFFFNHLDYEKEDLIRLWKANNFTTIFN